MVKQTLVIKKTIKKSQNKLRTSNTPKNDISRPPSPPPAPVPSPASTKKKSKKLNSSLVEEPSEVIIQPKKVKKTKALKKIEQKPSSKEPRLDPEMLERLSSVIDLADIEANGFSLDLWKSLSFEEKNSLPIYISLQFRTSSTREEKKKNQKQKQTLNSIMLKYQKLAVRQFYLANKKKIKVLREEHSISGNKATDMLWNTLSSEEKNDWYHQSTEKQQSEEVGEEAAEEEESDEEEE
jgi:hypothetical protein